MPGAGPNKRAGGNALRQQPLASNPGLWALKTSDASRRQREQGEKWVVGGSGSGRQHATCATRSAYVICNIQYMTHGTCNGATAARSRSGGTEHTCVKTPARVQLWEHKRGRGAKAARRVVGLARQPAATPSHTGPRPRAQARAGGKGSPAGSRTGTPTRGHALAHWASAEGTRSSTAEQGGRRERRWRRDADEAPPLLGFRS
jgi:hypothetical protein